MFNRNNLRSNDISVKGDKPTLMNLMDGKGGADSAAKDLKNEIVSACDFNANSNTYYFSSFGDDSNDGRTPQTAFKSVDKINDISLKKGDTLLLERSSVFRTDVTLKLSEGITLGAYGEGAKPEIWGSMQNYSGKGLWKKSSYNNIWVMDYNGANVGIIVINQGKMAGRKYLTIEDLSSNFDFVHIGSKLYLYSENNPNEYDDIEIGGNVTLVRILENSSNVTISNISIKYTGGHAIQAHGNVSDIKISGCEIGWVGGSLQGIDAKTLYGNAIEFWDSSKDITVEKNWIYQIYDAGITFQGHGPFSDITFANNLIEYTTMPIEYWSFNPDDDITNINIVGNIIRFTGYGWGANSANIGRTAHINAGWTAKDYKNLNVNIQNNIFDCSYQAIFRIPWATKSSLLTQKYEISENVYYQRSRTGKNDLGFGEHEKNIAFFYGVENNDLFKQFATNQTELEKSVKSIDANPTLISWIDD